MDRASLALALVVATGCAHPAATRPQEREAALATHQVADLPDVTLTAHTGARVALRDLTRAGAFVLAFGYVRCTETCPLTTVNLRRVQQLLGAAAGSEVRLLTITLDPEHDTPSVLARYAEEFGAGPGWWFLTGTPAEVDALRRFFGLADPDPSVPRTSHSALLVVGNLARQRWFALPSLGPPGEIASAALRLSR